MRSATFSSSTTTGDPRRHRKMRPAATHHIWAVHGDVPPVVDPVQLGVRDKVSWRDYGTPFSYPGAQQWTSPSGQCCLEKFPFEYERALPSYGIGRADRFNESADVIVAPSGTSGELVPQQESFSPARIGLGSLAAHPGRTARTANRARNGAQKETMEPSAGLRKGMLSIVTVFSLPTQLHEGANTWLSR